jgi:hypothetical protein
MKIKKILVVSLILLTMITIGAVSAHEDATALGIDGGEPSSSDEISLQSADDAVLGEDAKEDLNFTVTNDKEMVNYKEGVIYHSSEIYFEVEEGGNSLPVKLYVDDEECEITNFDMDSLFFNTSKLSLGEHKYVVNFLGNKFYNPASAGGAFNITEIAVNADEKYTYDEMDDEFFKFIDRKIRENGIYLRICYATSSEINGEAVFEVETAGREYTFTTDNLDNVQIVEMADYGIKIESDRITYGTTVEGGCVHTPYFAEFGSKRGNESYLSLENPFNKFIISLIDEFLE